MSEPDDEVRLPARVAPAITIALLGGFAVAACAVALAVALLVRYTGSGLAEKAVGAVADLVVVAAFAVLSRPFAQGADPERERPWKVATVVVALVAGATLAWA